MAAPCTLQAGAGEALPHPTVAPRPAAQAAAEVPLLRAFPPAWHLQVAHSSTAAVPCQAGKGVVVACFHQGEGGTAAGPTEEVARLGVWGVRPGHTLQPPGVAVV